MRNPFTYAAVDLGLQHFSGNPDIQYVVFLFTLLEEHYDSLSVDDPAREWTYDDAVTEVLSRIGKYRDRHFHVVERIMQKFAGRAKYGDAVR